MIEAVKLWNEPNNQYPTGFPVDPRGERAAGPRARPPRPPPGRPAPRSGAVSVGNEPNNQSHGDFHVDPRWEQFSAMAGGAARRIRALAPGVPIVLGGMSPIDASWLRLVASHGLVDLVDVVAVHGFPLDWNHRKIDHWPAPPRAHDRPPRTH